MRLEYLRPEGLSEDQQALWDDLVGGKRAAGRGSNFLTNEEGGLVGPFNAWLYSPKVGQRVQRLGEALRFGSSLPDVLLEVAILVTAQHWRAHFEWWAHARLARRAGVAPAAIAAIHEGREPEFDDADQRLVYDFCRGLLANKRVGDETYGKIRELLGEQGLVDLISLLGYYGLVSMTLNVFEVPLPEGIEAPFDD